MTVDYSKLTVDHIKQMLIDEGRYTEEEIKNLKGQVKGKAAWVALHQGDTEAEFEWGGLESELDNLVEQHEELVTNLNVENTEPKDPDVPRYKDPGWSDYVMSQFSPDELIDGKYPNVNALRRVVELLLGEIAFSGPIQTQTTLDPNHTGKAVVTYKIVIDWKLDAFYVGEVGPEGYPQREFLAVASSWIGNTDDMYAVFPESIAETRAEGRALRRALRLNVVCADELTKKDTAAIVQQQTEIKSTIGEWEEESAITDQQINTIEIMCKRLGINVMKFINSGSKEYNDIHDVTRSAAAGMLKQLNRYQSSGSDSIDIPQNLIGD